ncbi:MAG: phospholipase A [Azoarcus sp.]|jgi:outer membrane phospholipase A|nr:phospholipase A [Azoarcus sp.]
MPILEKNFILRAILPALLLAATVPVHAEEAHCAPDDGRDEKTPALPAHAADWLLAAPVPNVSPGQSFEVIVSGEPGEAGWPPNLSASVELPGKCLRVALELTAIGKPGPSRQRYFGRWPIEAVGVNELTLTDAAGARLLFRTTPMLPARALSDDAQTEDNTASVQTAEANLIAPADAANTLIESTALSFHEPMYIVFGGTHPRSARYQLSFRYRLFDAQGAVGKNLPVTKGLYFAFTQTAMWDLESESKPFRDTSFRPSLFFQWKTVDPPLGDSLALAGGYEHESNGRDGPDSRSIDTWIVRADLRHYLPDGRTYIGIEPKIWRYMDKSDNPDIARYRGYGQLGLRIGRDSALMLTAILRRGTAGVGSTQFDLSYPLRASIFSGVGTFVHVQYFNGYGQTLLEYKESRHPQIRVGVSLVR